MALGAAVLLGWTLDIQVLKSVHPSLASMKANTAVCFLLNGWALLGQAGGPRAARGRASRLGPWVVIAVALLNLAQHAFHVQLGIDELLFRDPSVIGTSAPGRMSPLTAVAHLLISLSLLGIDLETRNGRRPAQWLALVALAFCLLPLIGYLYGVSGLYAITGFNTIALHTTCGLVALAFGALLARPESGVMAPIVGAGAAARAARRLLPAVVLLPIALGWLRLRGQDAGLFDTRFGLAAIVATNVAALATLTWWAAAGLARSENDREQVLQRLAVSEDNLERTLESIGDGVIATDAEGRVVRLNAAAEALTGWSAHEAVGEALETVFRVVSEDTRAPIDDPVARVLRDGRVVELANHALLIARDGTERPVADSAAPIRDRSGRVTGVVLVFRDQTHERKAKQERERRIALEVENQRVAEASSLKSQFLANMSHELRTPLNSIIGFAELLHDGHAGPIAETQQEFLGDILTSARHLLQLINDVLDLSKVEAGKLELHPETIDPARVVDEVISILRTASATKRLRVDSEIASDLGEIVLDPARLKQVLYNFLSNALKFTPAGGQITVRVTAEDSNAIRFEVQDTGVGIAPGDLPRLFHDFEQLDSGAAKKHGGTGLGLALTRRLVEQQGGRVGVESELGKGSRFYAVLPRRVASMRRVLSSLPPVPPSERGGPCVLVVEDDRDDREAITRVLVEAGYAVEVVETGAAAIARCRERAYAAVALDLLLPDMTGLDVLAAVRSGGDNESVPVVIITVVTERATAGLAVHDVLGKPLDAGALLSSLRAAGVTPSTQPTVLVVDDDDRACKLAAAILEQLGCRAYCFSEPSRALEWLEGQRPAAILLDLLMPEIDGFQFLARVRTRYLDVPVLIWTAKDLSQSELVRLRREAAAVIAKGQGAVELSNALRAYLEARGGAVHAG